MDKKTKMARIKGKKGLGDVPAFIFSFLAFVFIALAFILMLGMRSCSNDTFEQRIESSESLRPQVHFIANTFLMTPIKFDINGDSDEENVMVSDLIAYSVANDDYEILEEKTRKFFNRHDFDWSMTIISPEEDFKTIKKFKRENWIRTDKQIEEDFLLPTYDGDPKIILVKVMMAEGEEYTAYGASYGY
ncbi:MAG: hypothetical protein V1740_03050 [Candidatus Woesearchaeota archaeon]